MMEKDLFLALCGAHIQTGGSVTINTFRYQRNIGLSRFEKIDDKRPKPTQSTMWYDVEPLLEDLSLVLDRFAPHLSMDDVVFTPEDGDAGVTWRCLKYDFPFLRIVLGKDKIMMRSVLNRLGQVLRDTLDGKMNKKE
jgi:hypothetical protein